MFEKHTLTLPRAGHIVTAYYAMWFFIHWLTHPLNIRADIYSSTVYALAPGLCS